MNGRAHPTRWTAREDAQLAALHPDYGALHQKLPNRTYHALRHRARQLGLVCSRHVWTNREVERLRRAFAHDPGYNVADLFPRLRLGQIQAKARHLNLARGRRLKDFDDPVLSVIRERTTQLCLTLVDLDERAGSGKYFQKASRKLSLRHAAQAVAVLGGSLSIAWGDEVSTNF